jgi:isoleucyl-tRNA synthetase
MDDDTLRYQPLFTFLLPDKPAYYVILEDYVTTEDGTGLVHTAPAFGAEDMDSSGKFDLPVLMTVSKDGTFVAEVRPWRGMFVKDADPLIIQDLNVRGLVLKTDTYTHTYPFCWRCDMPLLYYARSTWYVRTTLFKDKLVSLNQGINWIPEHVKTGRFGNWLENNVDWALGRERYWGTPLPIWRCTDCDHQQCVGSIAELSELAGSDLSVLDLHRPYVDEVKGVCPGCGGSMIRVPELIDVWFDSGSMPVAQWHYPFENQEIFKEQYPADFICEAVDQTRGWFYSLHAISTLLFERESFKNVICLGLILDEHGFKMSKSRGNIVDPWDVLNQHGADAFRWYLYTASAPGQERRFSVDLVGEVVRNFSLTLWNVYSFFVTYANLDGWQPGSSDRSIAYNDLDQWLRSELHGLVRDVTIAFELYDVPAATRPIQSFVDRLSNWYLRRSRRRFWKSESDADKNAAYATLYEALVTLSKLLAPTMPFMAEELYQNLVYSINPEGAESVHLVNWPIFDDTLIDDVLNQNMRLVMKLASLGHAARNKAGIKVRQPLAEVAFSVGSRNEMDILVQYANLLADELNVKRVRALGSAGEAVSYSLKPLPKQLGQKYKGAFPQVRAAILELDPEGSARALLDGHQLLVSIEGEAFKILPEEVEVRIEARSGLTVAAEGSYLAALKTELTEELVHEGLAREFIRRVQDMRRQADFNIADRIHINMICSPNLTRAVEMHRDYIMGETLVVELTFGEVPLDATTIEFDGERATLELKKA